MGVVNVVDAGVFRGIGKPPNEEFDTLRGIVTGERDTEIQLPRPIYAELGGDPGAESYPSGSDYVDTGIREGWISVADPIDEESPVADARRDARHVMEAQVAHPGTAVFEADLSLVGLVVQLFERAETIHVNLFTTDDPLRKAAVAVVQYYGYHDFDVYFAPPQTVADALLQPSHFGASYRVE
jgi:hypothetical protein